jgi:chlorobactene glucosyltransferase
MTGYFTHGIIISFIYFQVVILIIILSNIVLLRRMRGENELVDFPSVSILVPARNEEARISKCLHSLLVQDYPNFEVIVLDDQSGDNTADILTSIEIEYPGLKIITGAPTPGGFIGKSWACVQLAQHAQGDLLFFTDADTEFQPQALQQIVKSQVGAQADLLTGYPRQVLESWGERILVPFFLWALMCFIPLWLAYQNKISGISAAVGQLMLFRREAYQKIGGHAAVGTEIVEDIALAKNIKRAGLRWRVMNVTDLVSCRMYLGGQEAFDGFAKNIFAGFEFRLVEFLFVYLWLGLMFLQPLGILIAKFFNLVPAASYPELLICVGLSMMVWCIPYAELKVPTFLGVLYPITMIANEVVAIRSLILSMSGNLSWKGRRLPRPKWKWL